MRVRSDGNGGYRCRRYVGSRCRYYGFVLPFEQYGSIVIDSVRGQKDIYYERFGIRKSIFGAFDIIHFPWMYLSPGVNQFAFVMDDENYDNVTITIEHSGAYGGV